jgi:hypothetical protein
MRSRTAAPDVCHFRLKMIRFRHVVGEFAFREFMTLYSLWMKTKGNPGELATQ